MVKANARNQPTAIVLLSDGATTLGRDPVPVAAEAGKAKVPVYTVALGTGRVLNVASIASFQPVPSLATYAASKAYVLSLTESLSEELRGSGVSITALCPGITATGMLDQALDANPQVSRIPGFLIGDVTDVARQGFDACMKGEVICVPGVVNQAAILASRSTPKWLLRRISGLLGRQVQ